MWTSLTSAGLLQLVPVQLCKTLERDGSDIFIMFREGEGRHQTSVAFTLDDLDCLGPTKWLDDKVMVYRDMEWFIEICIVPLLI